MTGSPADGSAVRALTLGGVLARRAFEQPDLPYLRSLPEGRVMTLRELNLAANRVANGLAELGVSHGSHVGVVMDNTPEHVVMLFAIARLGAVSVLINTGARGEMLRHFLDLGEAATIVIDEAYLERLEPVAPELPKLKRIVVSPAGPRDLAGLAVHRYGELDRASDAAPGVGVRFSDPACIVFTSGTTGPSKGVLYPQARCLLYAHDYATWTHLGPSDVIYAWQPLFHVGGLQCILLGALLAGACLAMPRRFSASRLMDEVRETGTTVLPLVGATLNMLWSQPPSPNDRDHRVRLVSTVPVPSFAAAFQERFGVRIASGYGLTDYGMPVYYGPTEPASKLGSAGFVREGWEVRVVDEDDFDLPPGITGEIVIRCNKPWGAPLGYYRNPEATLAALRNGWFHTGDTGRLDEDGYLWFVGRSKDAIRRRGENISAFEVEQAIVRHPSVAEAAAYPVASELGEEEVAVSVVLREGTRLTEPELIDHCQAQLPRYMVPRFVMLADDLPRNLSQKVQKFKLRDAAERDREALWDREKAGIELRR